MKPNRADADWERMYAPYDPQTYREALGYIGSNDVVLDIGAGDLRFARQAATIARRVIAIEINPTLLAIATQSESVPLPANLTAICADARTYDFPEDVTMGVLLMRHCLQFKLYAEKLRDIGAQQLVTNARWRMGVEVVKLQDEARLPYASLELGAYACWCGAVGFKPGPVEKLTPKIADKVSEVIDCPQCFPEIKQFQPAKERNCTKLTIRG